MIIILTLEGDFFREFNYIKYCQYLISSQKNYTITNLADHLEKVSHDQINPYLKNIDLGTESLWPNVREEKVSHDQINPYLKNIDLGTESLWLNVREKIVTAKDGYLIFALHSY